MNKTTTCPLHIGVLVEQRYKAQAQPAMMVAALRARGHQVAVIDPQAEIYEMGNDAWLDGFDVIVGRGRSWAVLCLLSWAEARALPTINRRSAIAAVHNKAEMSVTLAAGKIPTPQTFFSSVEHLASKMNGANYPLILKPIFGDNCRGLRVVHAREEFDQLQWPEPVALAQRYLSGDAYDLKLYGIGDEIWAVRKLSPFHRQRRERTPFSGGRLGDDGQAELLPLSPELEELGRRCGALFGLDLYGVDCIQTPDGLSVIEVNEFPNYTGVPDAGERLADYVVRRAREESEA